MVRCSRCGTAHAPARRARRAPARRDRRRSGTDHRGRAPRLPFLATLLYSALSLTDHRASHRLLARAAVLFQGGDVHAEGTNIQKELNPLANAERQFDEAADRLNLPAGLKEI